MTDKTKSEVMAELEKDASVIRKHLGKDYEVKAHDFAYGGAYIEISNSEFKFGHINGVIRHYTPDPDTKEVALEKAKNEAFEQLTNGRHVSPVRLSDGAFVFFSGPEHDVSYKHKFVYAPAVKTSTDPITDEAPPKGTPVVCGYSHGYFLSLGNIEDRGLLVIGVSGIKVRLITYKSLTTPHRSKDWED